MISGRQPLVVALAALVAGAVLSSHFCSIVCGILDCGTVEAAVAVTHSEKAPPSHSGHCQSVKNRPRNGEPTYQARHQERARPFHEPGRQHHGRSSEKPEGGLLHEGRPLPEGTTPHRCPPHADAAAVATSNRAAASLDQPMQQAEAVSIRAGARVTAVSTQRMEGPLDRPPPRILRI